jgi:SpoVK/Ycf46/Vps4 family AAA+-type ATPase
MTYVESKHKLPVSDINYVVNSKTPIKLSDDIYFKKIYNLDGDIVVENNKGQKMVEHKYILYSTSRPLKELRDFLNELLDNLEKDLINDQNMKSMYYIYDREEDGLNFFDEYPLENDRTFQNIFFDYKDNLKERLDFFLNNREWYRRKGIPYTLGIMFSGKPGCGKTSTIKAIAKYTNRHIIDIPLSKIETCKELMNIFYNEEINDKIVPMNKRIYLFEDIDSILDILKDREDNSMGTENSNISTSSTSSTSNSSVSTSSTSTTSNSSVSNTSTSNSSISTSTSNTSKALDNLVQGITNSNELVNTLIQSKCNKGLKEKKNLDQLNLGFFLNLIDGVLETPGRILIISTNYPDKLDRALIRPGRIDIKINLEHCSIQVIKDILGHYYEVSDKILEEYESLINEFNTYSLTPAELYQFCFRYKSLELMMSCIKNEGFKIIFEKLINRDENMLENKQNYYKCIANTKCNSNNNNAKREIRRRYANASLEDFSSESESDS